MSGRDFPKKGIGSRKELVWRFSANCWDGPIPPRRCPNWVETTCVGVEAERNTRNAIWSRICARSVLGPLTAPFLLDPNRKAPCALVMPSWSKTLRQPAWPEADALHFQPYISHSKARVEVFSTQRTTHLEILNLTGRAISRRQKEMGR
jgi:hypothetical protein